VHNSYRLPDLIRVGRRPAFYVSRDSNLPTRGIQKEHALVELSARRTVTIADFEPQFGNLCMVYASTPELGGGSVTGVLERVNDATIARPRDLAVWRQCPAFPRRWSDPRRKHHPRRGSPEVQLLSLDAIKERLRAARVETDEAVLRGPVG
jgi:hypothetical protein